MKTFEDKPDNHEQIKRQDHKKAVIKRTAALRATALLLAGLLVLLPGCGLARNFLPEAYELPDPGTFNTTESAGQNSSDTHDTSDPQPGTSLETVARTSEDGSESTIDPSEDSQTQTQKETSRETAAETTVAVRREIDEAFSREAASLMTQQLEDLQRELVLDSLFEKYWITESQIDGVVTRLYDVFHQVYNQNPWFFYLNGSARMSYSLQTGAESRLKSMSLQPDYHTFAAGMSDAELQSVIRQVDQFVEQSAQAVRQQTTEPWQQLRLVHQFLIRHIVYDETENQDNNHAAAALLDGLTLCQGYAQAFQMIGQRLGHDVMMITGESNAQGHAWNLVKLNGQYYHVDVTHDDPVPDRGPDQPVRHLHFMRSDSIMRETHRWQSDQFPAAPQDGAHYYRQTGRTAGSAEEMETMLGGQLRQHDFEAQSVFFLELLYTGDSLPGRETVERVMQEALQDNQTSGQVYYRIHLGKSVIIVEVFTS